jgi:hypothetical protein
MFAYFTASKFKSCIFCIGLCFAHGYEYCYICGVLRILIAACTALWLNRKPTQFWKPHANCWSVKSWKIWQSWGEHCFSGAAVSRYTFSPQIHRPNRNYVLVDLMGVLWRVISVLALSNSVEYVLHPTKISTDIGFHPFRMDFLCDFPVKYCTHIFHNSLSSHGDCSVPLT